MNIDMQRPFLFFLKKPRPKNKKIMNINYLIRVLLKMRLLILLSFSQYGLACEYGITGCRIAFCDTWFNNFQSGSAVNKNLF